MSTNDKLFTDITDRLARGIIKDTEWITDDEVEQLIKQDPELWEYAQHEVEYRLTGDVTRHKKLDKQTTAQMGNNNTRLKKNIQNTAEQFNLAIEGARNGKLNDNVVSRVCWYAGLNDGELAALLGYDAINAEGHGQSGSYTVILNRTKTIFKKQ